jgi:hypothetical protein
MVYAVAINEFLKGNILFFCQKIFQNVTKYLSFNKPRTSKEGQKMFWQDYIYLYNNEDQRSLLLI